MRVASYHVLQCSLQEYCHVLSVTGLCGFPQWVQAGPLLMPQACSQPFEGDTYRPDFYT